MKVERVVCDYCGEEFEPQSDEELQSINVRISRADRGQRRYDFCNDGCLVNFFSEVYLDQYKKEE